MTREKAELQFSTMVGVLVVCIGMLAGLGYVPDAGAQPLKIGFLLKTMQEARYQSDKAFFTARAEALGAEIFFNSSSNRPFIQTQQFEQMLEEGCQVIVLQPANTATAGELVEMAHKVGVKVVGYDSMLEYGPLDVMVMQDSWAVGRLQGEAMLAWLQRKYGEVKGNVALIMGHPGDTNADAMSQGLVDIVKQHPNLKLVAREYHLDWSPDQARETANRLLFKYNNNIDAFICNNSGLATGVISALELEGLADADQVFVAGADADLTNIHYLLQGKQSVEIWKKIKPLAYQAADIAVALAKNPTVPVIDLPELRGAIMINNGFTDVPTLITPVVLITQDNIDSTLIAEQFFTREEVYGKGR